MKQKKTNNQTQDDQIDFIARTVADNSEKLEQLEEKLKETVTKEEHQDIINKLDALIKLANKKDQEIAMISQEPVWNLSFVHKNSKF